MCPGAGSVVYKARVVRTDVTTFLATFFILVARAKLFEFFSLSSQNGIFVARAGFFFVLSSPPT